MPAHKVGTKKIRNLVKIKRSIKQLLAPFMTFIARAYIQNAKPPNFINTVKLQSLFGVGIQQIIIIVGLFCTCCKSTSNITHLKFVCRIELHVSFVHSPNDACPFVAYLLYNYLLV